MAKVICNLIDGTAAAYLLAYTCLMEKDKEVREYYSDKLSVYIFPATINAALSCEIALKNLIYIQEKKFIRGHNLKKLFQRISPKLQKKYLEQTISFYNEITLGGKGNLSPTEFMKCLDEAKETYEHKRYIYEKAVSIDIDFLEALMFSLNDAREEYIDFKKSVMG